MRMRSALAALALAVTLGACGDDSMSTDEYRSELRTICREADRQSAQIEQPTRATPDAIADYLRRLRDTNARTVQRVQELDPPDELEDAHERALDANRQGRERVDEVIRQLEEGGDPQQVLTEARSRLQESSRAAQQAARDVGVPECGNAG